MDGQKFDIQTDNKQGAWTDRDRNRARERVVGTEWLKDTR